MEARTLMSITANCVRCMISCGCDSALIDAKAHTDGQGRYMARGRCGCCSRAVEQYVRLDVYEALK